MIDVKQTFLKRYPNKEIQKISNYDTDNVLIIAMDKGHKEEVGDPNFLVNKKTGSIRQINPLEDMDKFFRALNQEDKKYE